jgi:DNA-binding XRE family transcriptional regulator
MTAHHDAEPLRRLAGLIAQRRVDLGMNKIDMARTAGLTITTYSKVEAGLSVRDVTYAKIEPILGWATGSCRHILNGGSAPTVIEPSSVEGISLVAIPADGFEEDLSQAVTSAMVAVADNLTAAEIREISRRAMEELKRRGVI